MGDDSIELFSSGLSFESSKLIVNARSILHHKKNPLDQLKRGLAKVKVLTSIRDIKIRNIEHAIEQAELMIKESKMSQEELIFLKRKISDSRQDLEILYLMKIQ